MSLALYIHIPFCVSKCHYCDFNSIGMGRSPLPEAEYLAAALREVGRWTRALSEPPRAGIDTVFFGGGTPSLFRPESIAALLRAAAGLAPLSPHAEITLELNPKTAETAKMRGFREAGCNRLSIGVQTLDETLLAGLARAHTAEDALQALEWAFAAGFAGVNADLMYGLPHQDGALVAATLERLQRFPLQHLSAYELIVEEGTPFYDRYLQGRLPLPRTEEVLAMRDQLEAFAAGKGMSGYEISNYAQPGRESRHNLHYWDYDSFVGVGAGAVSFLRKDEVAPQTLAALGIADAPELYGLRLTNPKGLAEYQASASGWDRVEVEPIARPEARAEFMMMGLRKRKGIFFRDFEQKFAEAFPERFLQVLRAAQGRGRAALTPEACCLTEAGLLLSNEILQEFLPASLH